MERTLDLVTSRILSRRAGVGKNTGTPFANVMKPTRDVTPS